MLRVLEWYDGHMNLGLSHGVRKSCLGKVGIWGGDALGEKTGLSAMSVLLSYPAALCILSSERRAFSRGTLVPHPRASLGKRSHTSRAVWWQGTLLLLWGALLHAERAASWALQLHLPRPPGTSSPVKVGNTLFPSRLTALVELWSSAMCCHSSDSINI